VRGPRPFARSALAIALLYLFLLLLLLAGCDGFVAEAPPITCVEVGTQCQLAAGPLGVCEQTICAAGEVPPCFTCTPQH
jgi:hypothetical protein